MYWTLAIFAGLVFSYSLVSHKVEKVGLSGPIVFVALGIVLSPLGFGVFSPTPTGIGRSIVDVTLALFLFVDAAAADLGVLRRNWRLPGRMVVFGLPMAIALGSVCAAWLFPELSIYEAAILGTMLAATDAALGKAVVTNKAVPDYLREGLSAESGLNDGLAVPFLLLFIALEQGGAVRGEGVALELMAEELGIGLIVGALVAYFAANLLRAARDAGWLSHVWQQVAIPALAIATFAIAQSMHGSGYIAAFVGGLCFRAWMKEDVHGLLAPAEGVGEVLAMVAWIIFGLLLVPAALPLVDTRAVIYALLSLTVVRMAPIIVSLAGTGERMAAKSFLAWFGPRGLASLAFAIIVWGEDIANAPRMISVTVLTVLLCLVAHGITAQPLGRKIAAAYARS